MHERKAVIASRVGLHARPAGIFAEAVGELTIEVPIALEDNAAEDAMDASSILSLMSLGAANSDIVILRAEAEGEGEGEGEGAVAALGALITLLETDLDAE
ncbi:HPr family phosphocarrier protein [Cryobacterium sp. TMT1-2-1]|uniref:HPr family phosphocarrier protein n=1 Tax=Cryobacterium sp. TMT1-2-1 TaxID=1259232 RepID=UPI0010692717|nr:HPr family phosphocarrier protein [Cryobacterium sp. TMT1-2-1]TFD45753.1 HPr family phosphocarrier protein [Cryobacterium sp. TMT1-2-1]